jgi:hypothetical protein
MTGFVSGLCRDMIAALVFTFPHFNGVAFEIIGTSLNEWSENDALSMALQTDCPEPPSKILTVSLDAASACR